MGYVTTTVKGLCHHHSEGICFTTMVEVLCHHYSVSTTVGTAFNAGLWLTTVPASSRITPYHRLISDNTAGTDSEHCQKTPFKMGH